MPFLATPRSGDCLAVGVARLQRCRNFYERRLVRPESASFVCFDIAEDRRERDDPYSAATSGAGSRLGVTAKQQFWSRECALSRQSRRLIICGRRAAVSVRGSSVMAYDLDSRLDNAKLAENQAFRRLYEMPDLDDWDEAFAAWLRAARRLRQESLLARVL